MPKENEPAPPIRGHDSPPHYRTRRLGKSGASLGIYLPKDYCDALGMARGTEVKVYLIGGVMVIQKRTPDEHAPGVIAVAGAAPKEE